MLRRKPTRLELKLDDTEEFESVKKELEVAEVVGKLHVLTYVIEPMSGCIDVFCTATSINSMINYTLTPDYFCTYAVIDDMQNDIYWSLMLHVSK